MITSVFLLSGVFLFFLYFIGIDDNGINQKDAINQPEEKNEVILSEKEIERRRMLEMLSQGRGDMDELSLKEKEADRQEMLEYLNDNQGAEVNLDNKEEDRLKMLEKLNSAK